MGKQTDDRRVTVKKGDEHLGARVDSDTYRMVRIAAAERDEPMTEFVRNAVADALAELEEGNAKPKRMMPANS